MEAAVLTDLKDVETISDMNVDCSDLLNQLMVQ